MKKRDLQRQLRKLQAELRKSRAVPKAVAAAPKKPSLKIPPEMLARTRARSPQPPRELDGRFGIFTPSQPMPGVVPSGSAVMAMDDAFIGPTQWAATPYAGYGAFAEGLTFMGYPYLAELAQRPEYRVISETIATEMTRKWIRITSIADTDADDPAQQQNSSVLPFKPKPPATAQDFVPPASKPAPTQPPPGVGHNFNTDKAIKIKELTDFLDDLGLQAAFCKVCELDGFFGRAHLFLDLGDDMEAGREELKTPIGNGRNAISQAKLKKGCLKRIQVVEPIWTYPTNYNANNPLIQTWYEPEVWFVMGREVHASRLLTFIGHEVPDLFKPAYSFGGLSLSQMAKPYVDNWLRTRQSVSDIVQAFTVFVLKTDLETLLAPDAGSGDLFDRAQLFNNLKSNLALMMVNKDTEDFANVSATLSTLDTLQAQAQEHMASVTRIPLVKLLGVSPAGLNATSEGEIRVFYDTIAAHQEKFFANKLRRIIDIAMVSLWGAVDEDIRFEFEPLWSLDEKGEAEVRKIEADTDAVLVDLGALDQNEVRRRVASDPDSPHSDLDVNKVITPPDAAGAGSEHLGLGQGGGIGGNPAASFAGEAG